MIAKRRWARSAATPSVETSDGPRKTPGFSTSTRFRSLEDYRNTHVSYYHRSANYSADEVDANGRKIHINSVTGEEGAKRYDDGRKIHINSVTGEEGAKRYADGRQQHPTYDTGRKQHKEYANSTTGEAGAMGYADGRKQHPTHETGRKKHPTYATGRKKTRLWTEDEKDAVRDGVRRFGKKWDAILKHYSETLQHRTKKNLQDFWHLEKKKLAAKAKK